MYPKAASRTNPQPFRISVSVVCLREFGHTLTSKLQLVKEKYDKKVVQREQIEEREKEIIAQGTYMSLDKIIMEEGGHRNADNIKEAKLIVTQCVQKGPRGASTYSRQGFAMALVNNQVCKSFWKRFCVSGGFGCCIQNQFVPTTTHCIG